MFDFEFSAQPGERPKPICAVAWELRSGRRHHLWEDDLARLGAAPYPTGPQSLLVAYYASAELGCHLALGWPLPVNVLDLYTEFRNATNGLPTPCGSGLLGALVYFGLDSIGAVEKESMRQMALRGGPWSNVERRQLLDYCESDVHALAKLLPNMEPHLDLERALLRGRYMKAAANMEHVGVPIDMVLLDSLRENWPNLKTRLVERVDADYNVYEGTVFKRDGFARFLAANNIPWPRLVSGQLRLDDETFRQSARRYPVIEPIRQLRKALSQLRLEELTVGADGRNRCLLSAFRSRYLRRQSAWNG